MAKESAGGGEGRQERRRWRVRNALGLLSRPSRIDFSGDVPSGSPLRGGTLAAWRMRRGALIPGILVLAMMAALLASVIMVPPGLNGPPAAVAQGTVCGPAILTLSPLAEGLSVTFKYDSIDDSIIDPTGYRFRHALSGGNDWSDWDDFTVTTGVFVFNVDSEWTASKTVYGLQPLTSYKVEAMARCSPTLTSSAATLKTVTTSKTRTVSITLTRNGSPIRELAEGQSGTLTLTLDSNDVYVGDVDVSAVIIPASQVFEGNVLPRVLQGEVTIGIGAFETKTLSSGATTLSWTVTAVADSVYHSAATDDDEHPRESALITISPASVANGAFEVSSSSWDGALRIRDNDPINPVMFGNNLATGTVSVRGSSTGAGPEIRDTVTASVGDVSDTDGAPSGGYVYVYAWLDDGVPIPGAVSTTYEVGVADIGRILTARVQFRDALNNLETLTSAVPDAVPSGPVITAPNGYVWDSHPQTDNTITVDTSAMTYSYMADPPEFTYLWVYMNANGTERVMRDGFGGRIFPSGNTTPGSDTYPLAEVDEDEYMQVRVTFTDTDSVRHTRFANMQTPQITESTIMPPPPPPPPPTATATPVVNNPATGTVTIDDTTPEVRQTLTASVNGLGDLDGFDVVSVLASGWQWLRGGRPIDGVTGSTYVVQGEDIGLTLSARITFTDDLGTPEMLTSDPTTAVASGPVIQAPTGYFWDDDPTTANTISVDTSVMNYSYLPSGATFTYQWIYVDIEGTELKVYEDANGNQFVNPTNIAPDYTRVYASGTTSSDEYELTMVDDDKYLQVRVSFTDSGSVLQTKLANIQTPQISEFSEPPDQFGNYDARGIVTISDTTPEIRDILTASLSNVSDRNGLTSPTYSYQWYDGGRPIRHAEGNLAVGNTYRVEVKDIGRTLSVQVRFMDDERFSEMLTSEPAAVVPSGPVIELDSGSTGYFYDDVPTTNNTITVDTSAMTYSYLPSGATFTYQWIYVREDGTKDGEASATDSTSQTYGLTSADHDKYLQVEVTFAGVTKLANMRTPQIADVPPGPDGYKATGTVTITNGTLSNTEPEVGDILTATPTDVADRDGLPASPTYGYVWNTGRGLRPGGNTYEVHADDIPFRLSVRVSFRDSGRHTEFLDSEETKSVRSGPVISPDAGEFLWDNDSATNDIIRVDTTPSQSVMTYTYLLENPTFTYQWIYVDEDGGNPVDVPDATSDTYILTSADDMKYLQVEVTFTDRRSDSSVTKLANKKTFQIVERQSLQIPTGLTATTSSEDGNVRLRWSLTTSGDIPAGFKYRYKPTALADTEFTAWVTASGGPSARSVTITGNLINNAQYTFEVASYTSQVAQRTATTASKTAVYRQKTRGC